MILIVCKHEDDLLALKLEQNQL